MTTVGVLVRSDLGEAGPALEDLVRWLRARDITACIDDNTAALVPGIAALATVAARQHVADHADVMVVLGGDGTLLEASHAIERPIPVLGVNFGSLGFLTEITLPELYNTLQRVLDGDYDFDERYMLRAIVHRDGTPILSGDVLNDVVLTKTALSRIIEVDVSVDGSFVSGFRADGLIVSSPTGSTAYNLAAGGPIVHPSLPAIVLTPICPHMLTNRPLVVSADAFIEIRLGSVRDEVYVTFDGQSGMPLSSRDLVTITRSPRSLRLVRSVRRDYFEVLRTKLKWGESTVRRE